MNFKKFILLAVLSPALTLAASGETVKAKPGETPAINLYVASSISKLGLTDVTKATWPWLVTALIFLGLVTYIPAISMALPHALGMR